MFEPREWTYKLKTQVGGVAGVGETATVTQIIWSKNEFYEGEYSNVRIVCDNSACKHAVKNFIFEILQHREIKSADNEPVTECHKLSGMISEEREIQPG